MSAPENKKPAEENQANEPSVNYQASAPRKEISFFNSFEEMEQENYKWLASLTPEQHLQNATALIKRIFAEDLKKNPRIGNRLIID